MDYDEEENGLFNIDIAEAPSEEATQKAARRTGQTEEAFQAIRQDYRPKIENGDIAKGVHLPLGADAPKMQIQEVIHAVEELYFFRKYEEAVDLVKTVLHGSGGVDEETRQLLTVYSEKCQQKVSS